MRFTILHARLITLKGISDFDIRISSLCYINSTKTYVRIYKQFMHNEPNFPQFSNKNDDKAKKRTQFKANTNPILAQKSGGKPNSNPIKANFIYPNFERVFHLIYENRLINWRKSRRFTANLQNRHYQYNKPAFIAVRIPDMQDFL